MSWQLVTDSNRQLGHAFLAIMCQMDRHYQDDEPDLVVDQMLQPGRFFFVGIGKEFQIAIGYQFDEKRTMFQIRCAGFVGDIEPCEALDLMLANWRSFAKKLDLDTAYTIVPHRMDNPRIVQLYGLLPWRDDLKVLGGRHLPDGIYWRMRLVDSPQSCGCTSISPARLPELRKLQNG